MLISQLAISELREITSLLLAQDIYRLCLCGNSILTNKLVKNGGAVDLRFTIDTLHRQESWPSWLRQFTHLDRLFIDDHFILFSPPITREDLLGLPKELRSLILGMSSVVQAFSSALKADRPRYECLTTLVLQNSSHNPASRVHKIEWPSNLATLDVGDATLSLLDVTKLPSSLTDLRGWFRSLLPVSEDALFPETLKTVVLEFTKEFSIDVVSKLSRASSLKVLSLNFPRNLNTKNRRAPALPSLKAPPAEFLTLLPRSIEVLEVFLETAIKISEFELLPPGLKLIRGILPAIMLKPHFFKLPPSITHFRSRIPITDVNHLSTRWPSTIDSSRTDENGIPLVTGGITRLRIGPSLFGNHVPVAYPVIVPPSVTKMTLDCTVRDEDGVRYSIQGPLVLSPSTTALKIRDGYSTGIKEMKKGLPPHLKVFANSNGFSSPECLSLLPRSLTVLSAIVWSTSSGFPYTPETASWMPPNLVKLELGPISLTSFTWINNLPRSLTDLRLNITAPTAIDCLPIDEEPLSFPPKLTLLQFWLSPKISFVARLLQHLPSSLISFSINHKALPAITDSDLSQLPRKLQSLYLAEHDRLTSNCLPMLPPHVSLLRIGYSTPEWFDPRAPKPASD